jgi:hypothetical protein
MLHFQKVGLLTHQCTFALLRAGTEQKSKIECESLRKPMSEENRSQRNKQLENQLLVRINLAKEQFHKAFSDRANHGRLGRRQKRHSLVASRASDLGQCKGANRHDQTLEPSFVLESEAALFLYLINMDIDEPNKPQSLGRSHCI